MAFVRFIMLYYNEQLFTVNLPRWEPVRFPDSVTSRSICRNSSVKVDILSRKVIISVLLLLSLLLYRCDRIPLTFSPLLVLQVRPSLLASTAAVTVVPLLPPQPTSITPSRGTFLSVRKVMSLVQGVTCFQDKSQTKTKTSHQAQMHLGTMQTWGGPSYRDGVALPVHCCGLVGVLGCNVCVCVCYISAVDVDVHRHGCRV